MSHVKRTHTGGFDIWTRIVLTIKKKIHCDTFRNRNCTTQRKYICFYGGTNVLNFYEENIQTDTLNSMVR